MNAPQSTAPVRPLGLAAAAPGNRPPVMVQRRREEQPSASSAVLVARPPRGLSRLGAVAKLAVFSLTLGGALAGAVGASVAALWWWALRSAGSR